MHLRQPMINVRADPNTWTRYGLVRSAHIRSPKHVGPLQVFRTEAQEWQMPNTTTHNPDICDPQPASANQNSAPRPEKQLEICHLPTATRVTHANANSFGLHGFSAQNSLIWLGLLLLVLIPKILTLLELNLILSKANKVSIGSFYSI